MGPALKLDASWTRVAHGDSQPTVLGRELSLIDLLPLKSVESPNGGKCPPSPQYARHIFKKQFVC